MTPAEALKLLQPIPEESFMEGAYTNGKDKCCVMGHLTRLTSKNPKDFSEDNCDPRHSRFEEHSKKVTGLNDYVRMNIGQPLERVNNGWVDKFKLGSVKDRVIACLESFGEKPKN